MTPATAPATPSSPGLSVLLVEDDALHQMVSRRLLERLGATVDLATNGLEALTQATHTRYDMVFMDIQMPVMDGIKATRALRHAGLDQLPIVAMTSCASPADQRAYAAAGVNDLVPKPVDARHLADTLARWRPEASRAAFPAVEPPLTLDGLPVGIPGLDVAGALTRMLGRKDLYLEMLQRYDASQGPVPAQLRAALEAGDRAQARRLAHTAKGLAATVGALHVAADAQAVEQALRDEAVPADVHLCLALFERRLGLLQEALQTWQVTAAAG